MDATQYYITTLTNAATKLLPYFIFIVGGYFVFVKLPFFFFMKSMDVQKKKLEEEGTPELQKLDHSKESKRISAQTSIKKDEPKKIDVAQDKKDYKENKRTDQKQDFKQERRQTPRPVVEKEPSPESVFNFRPGEQISKSELKKRYFELLKQNHPDRVASMGTDFKKLAEKNTKEINKAYDKLKSKAA